ncbi:hypothetical protein ACRRTK_024974 [Alexandromys fortis]
MEGEQPSVLLQCFNTGVRVSWRAEGNADSDSEANLPTVPRQHHLPLATREILQQAI